MGGRLVLLKFVLSALPIYFFSLFKVPPGTIFLIESHFKKFFKGEGGVVRKPRKYIGLSGRECAGQKKKRGGGGEKKKELIGGGG
jgi:hypothetical protein